MLLIYSNRNISLLSPIMTLRAVRIFLSSFF
nr:MAG TPA: hypothetical protein [Bacteriophage sp.]